MIPRLLHKQMELIPQPLNQHAETMPQSLNEHIESMHDGPPSTSRRHHSCSTNISSIQCHGWSPSLATEHTKLPPGLFRDRVKLTPRLLSDCHEHIEAHHIANNTTNAQRTHLALAVIARSHRMPCRVHNRDVLSRTIVLQLVRHTRSTLLVGTDRHPIL